MTRRLLLCLAVLGCQITGTIGRDDPNGGSGGGTSAIATDTEAVATDAGSIASAEGGGTGGGSEDESTAGALEGSGDTTASIPHACIPTPDDSMCAQCRKVNCCEPLVACLGHDSCTCWWDCMATDGHTTDACAMSCETDGLLFNELQTCSHNHCDTCL